jgi:hypothetical protein
VRAGKPKRRWAVALILGGMLLLSPPAAAGGFIWDLGIAFGYICVLLVVGLYLFPVRADGLPHSRLLGLSQHRRIGWWTLAAALLHSAVLLIAEPSVGRYFLPSAPVFMWCGVAAAIVAAALIQTGLGTRSALRRAGSATRVRKTASLHIALAAAMVVGLGVHIFGSAQFASGAAKSVALGLLLALPLVWFALRSRPPRSNQSAARKIPHVAAAITIALLPLPTAKRMTLEPISRPDRIAVNFPHDRHDAVNCVTCHHNFVDHTGTMACIDCHRSERPDLTLSSEATFHTFCRDCHTQLAVEGRHHGPTRSCSACHQAEVSGNTLEQPLGFLDDRGLMRLQLLAAHVLEHR